MEINSLGKAIAIASKAFENKKDKGGNPYILHCLFVMNKVSHLGKDAMVCAVLHDLLEDCPEWNATKLHLEGFDENIIATLIILTHEDSISYDDYIKRISISKIATYIKLADLEHNSSVVRLKGLTKKDFDRLEKYCRSYTYLSNSHL